jgi:AcrR family transcriptional regulator
VAVRERKPAALRRAEILEAAAAEFAETGLAGTRLEAIGARAAISHPRIVQLFGSKHALFLEVIDGVFDHVERTFAAVEEPTLLSLGDSYRRLLSRERAVGLLMLQGYAAAADQTVRQLVARRYLGLQRVVTHFTDADALQLRTFFAAGLVITITTVLELPGRRIDATWGAWLLQLAATSGAAGVP